MQTKKTLNSIVTYETYDMKMHKCNVKLEMYTYSKSGSSPMFSDRVEASPPASFSITQPIKLLQNRLHTNKGLS